MKVISLQSGSRGNCIYVETEKSRLIFDAGISGKAAEDSLSLFGRDIRDVDAVFISHDHSDHIKSAGIFSRKFGHKVAMSKKTYQYKSRDLGDIKMLNHFTPGDTVEIGDVCVHTIITPHDGVDSCSFVIESGGKRLGILTDLGHVFEELPEIINSLDAVMLESNYDPYMLDNGPYPWNVRSRIKGPGGHISNLESAMLVSKNAAPSLKWVCLSHISENNNTYAQAYNTHRDVIDVVATKNNREPYQILIATQNEPMIMPDF